MRNIKLRVLSIVISFMMVVSLFPVSIFADADVTDLSNTNDTESTTTPAQEESDTESEFAEGENTENSDSSENDMPKATVSVLEPMTLTAADHKYMVWPNGDSTIDRPLQIVMNFKAQETLAEAQAGKYGKWKCDFYLTVTGTTTGSVIANNCYLAGNYGGYGWIVIPTDTVEISEGVSNPIVSAYDANLTYENICDYVKDFTAAIYIAPEILSANPKFKVELALKMTNPENSDDMLTIGEPAVYTVADLLGKEVEVDQTVVNEIIENKATEEEKTIASTTVTEIKENTSLMGYAPKNVPEDAELVIKLKDIVTETTTEAAQATKIVYDVAPMKDGDKVDNNTITETITFRLPIPSSITDDFVNVYHNNELMGTFAVNGNGTNGRYVEVSTKSFSEFAIERTAEKMVAQIGNTGYATLQDAIDAAEASETVKIISNIALAEGVTVSANATVVIDLNGYTVSRDTEAAKSTAAITNNGNLNIKDSVGGGKITAFAANPDTAGIPYYANNTITNHGILTVEGGTIENSTGDEARAAFPIDNYSGATLYIKGGVITGRGAIRQFATNDTNNAVIITGGTVTGTSYGIWVQNSDYSISTNNHKAELTISGGVVSKVLLTPSLNITVEISGGKIGEVAIWDADTTNTDRNPSGFITGGTFTTDVSEFCADGYAVKDNGDGTFSVVADPAIGKVAVIGDTYYATLEEAFAAVKTGETIKLIADLTFESDLNNSGKGVFNVADGVSIVFDMNGHKITVTDNSTGNFILFYVYGEMTIKNGTIELTATNNRAWNAQSTIILNRGGVLTVENGTYTHNGGTDMAFVFDNSGNWYGEATTNIVDGTITSSYIAIRNRMEQNSHGASGTAILNITGGTIAGTSRAIWAQAASTSTTSPATGKINIYGGTIGLIDTARSEGAVCDTVISSGNVESIKCEVGELTVTGGTVGEYTILDASGNEVAYTITSDGKFILRMIVSVTSGNTTTEYASLAVAYAAAQNGDTIKLLADIELESPITVEKGKVVILDLCGYTITYTGTTQGEAMITNKGTLTINDSVGTGVINYNYVGAADPKYGKGNYTISNCGTLTVNGGKITIANLRQHAKYPINNDSTSGDAILVINDGHLYNYNTSAIRQFCNSTTYKNSVTINGGLIEGYSAVWVQNPGSKTVHGSLTITGGEIKTTAAAYVNGTSELKDVSSKIYCTTEGGAWSDDSAISITGGTFNENVYFAGEAPENITIGESATFNGRVELPEKAPAIVVPDDVVDSIVGDNTADKDTVQEIVDEIQNNAAVNDESYKPVENNDDVEELVVSLNGMTVTTDDETTAVTEIVYTVTPQDASGNKVSTPAQPITFKLPIPAGMTGTHVEVLHNGVPMGVYKILGEGAHRYVEIESANFSEFTVKTTNATEEVVYVAAVGSTSYATLDEALDAAKSGDVIVLLGNVETDMVFLRKGVTLDLAGYTLTADYVTVYTDAAIIDNSNMAGRLVANADLSIKGDNGGSMPLYIDGEGYAFVTMVMNSKLDTENLAEGILFKVKFRPSINDSSELNATYFGDNGASDNEITISIRLSWESNGSVVTQDFTFSDELIAKVYAGTDFAPALNITSLPADITSVNVIAVVTSATGVELVSNVGSFNIQ